MSTVLVTGTFDGLHPGHESLFRQAKKHGGRLVVVVARDHTVLDVKGQLPRMNEQERRNLVESHSLVDEAILGRRGDKLAVICDVKPDVLVLGYDQGAFTENLEIQLHRRKIYCKIVRAEPFHPEKFKSSLIYGEPRNDLVIEAEEVGIESENAGDWLPMG